MSEQEKMIERQVDRTLQCLDEIETLEDIPFFYPRLWERIRALEERKGRAPAGIFITRALRPACVALLVVLNVATALYLLCQERPDQREASIAAFAESYSLFGNSDVISAKWGGE